MEKIRVHVKFMTKEQMMHVYYMINKTEIENFQHIIKDTNFVAMTNQRMITSTTKTENGKKRSVYPSPANGLNTLNALFASLSSNSQAYRSSIKKSNTETAAVMISDALKLHAKESLITAPINTKNKQAYVLQIVHPTTLNSDLDNVGLLNKWVFDAMQAIRVVPGANGSLVFGGIKDTHQKTTIKSDDLIGEPLMYSDNAKHLPALHQIVGKSLGRNYDGQPWVDYYFFESFYDMMMFEFWAQKLIAAGFDVDAFTHEADPQKITYEITDDEKLLQN